MSKECPAATTKHRFSARLLEPLTEKESQGDTHRDGEESLPERKSSLPLLPSQELGRQSLKQMPLVIRALGIVSNEAGKMGKVSTE